MDKWDLVSAINHAGDAFLCEALDETGGEVNKRGFRRTLLVAAAVLLVVFLGSRLLFVHGSLRYRVVEFRNPLKPIASTSRFPIWNEMVSWERYPKVKYKGEWYFVVLKENAGGELYEAVRCEAGKLEGGEETGRAVGKETKRCIIGYVEILHETKVSVSKISGGDAEEMIAVRFEGEEGFYYYRRMR